MDRIHSILLDNAFKMVYFIVIGKLNIVGIGALRGLIGKFGVMPTRSRHCNGEQFHDCATEMKILGRHG